MIFLILLSEKTFQATFKNVLLIPFSTKNYIKKCLLRFSNTRPEDVAKLELNSTIHYDTRLLFRIVDNEHSNYKNIRINNFDLICKFNIS
jgi:hypothetical protein